MEHGAHLPQTSRSLWGSIAAVLVTIAVYIGGQVVAGSILSVVPLFTGWSYDRLTSWLDMELLGQFLGIALVQFATIGLLWMFLSARKIRWAALGLRAPSIGMFGHAIVVYLCYLLVSLLIPVLLPLALGGINIHQPQELGFKPQTIANWELVPVGLALVLFAPFVEEVLMRGFLYTELRKKLRFGFAAVVTSGLFALPHLQFGTGNPLLWIAAIDTFALSLFLVYARETTNNLWPPIFIHMLKNGTAFVLLFVFKIS